MARLIETESEKSSTTEKENHETVVSFQKNKMNSLNNSVNIAASSPRKFSFKTKQHAYNHTHYQPKLVATKLKVTNTSTVAELANKFNTIIVNDGDKNNRHQVILKRKHSVDSSNTRNMKDLSNTVKEAIRIFEQSKQNEKTSDSMKQDVNDNMKKSPRIVVIRKHSTHKVKKIASSNHSHEDDNDLKGQSQNTLRKSVAIAKETSSGTLPELRSNTSIEKSISSNKINKMQRPLSIDTDLNKNKWTNSTRNECELFLTNIRNNLRHTSMVNLNNYSNNDQSYHQKITDKYLINEYDTLKPELKPKPKQSFLRDRRKSIGDIRFLLEDKEDISTATSKKELSRNIFRSTNTIHSKSKHSEIDQPVKESKIECLVKKSVSTNELHNQYKCNCTIEKSSSKTSLNDTREGTNEIEVDTFTINTKMSNASLGVDLKKTTEIDEKVIKNNRLSIPKISSEFENILNRQIEETSKNITEPESFNANNSQKMKNKIKNKDSCNDQDCLDSIGDQYETVDTLEGSNIDNYSLRLITDKTDTNQSVTVPTKPNSSFLWRSVIKDSKNNLESKNCDKSQDKNDMNVPSEKDSNDFYSYIEINSDKSDGESDQNKTPLHQKSTATYKSLPNLINNDIDDDAYEELNYYSGHFYVPKPPEKKFVHSENIYEAAPMLPKKNSKNILKTMSSTHPDISKDTPRNLDHSTRVYENKNLPDLVRQSDGENHYYEPKLITESIEPQLLKPNEKTNTLSRGRRPILSNIDDKYAIIVKPVKRDQESNYNYESILSVKDDSHYNSIQDDTYDDVLNVMSMDNCYESIKAESPKSECGSFWEKDNSIYGIKAPSVLSNNSSVTTVSSETLPQSVTPTEVSSSYKNVPIPYSNAEHDSFSDSFDSDSDASSAELESRGTIHERSLPPPPTSSAQVNQNIYGFVKEAGRQMKKHWSLSTLGLNKIRKMSVGAIAQLPSQVLPKSPEPDAKQHSSPISSTLPLPSRARRWSSFKTKFRPHTTSTFYLDEVENTPPAPHSHKTETTPSPPPLPEKDYRRKSIALGSLSSNDRDLRRQSLALRPSSPPPPPPVNSPAIITVSTDESLNISSKSDKSLTSNSWYAESGLFDPTANIPSYLDNDQIKHLPPQGNAFWDNLWDSGNSSTPGATSNSDTTSDPGSDLHLRFIDEPLYQFYNACIAELQLESPEENGYEEIGSSPNRTSMIEIIAPSHMNRSLWCQLPEVIESGILDTLDAGQRKLQEAKFELITSEASYVKSLSILEKHFIASPLLADTNVLSKNDRKHLFGNVSAVRKCSERLLAALEQCWQDSLLLTNICEVVYQHVTNKSFNIYIKYCSNQFHIDRTLKSLRDTNPKFVEALTELESDSVCQSLSLHSFLMLPMQRVTRLPLLFDAILTRLRPNHSEYETCHTALATLNKIVHECNEEARKMERYYEMLMLSRLIKFSAKEVKCLPVISSSRWLVRSGSLNFVNVDAKMTLARKLNKMHYTKLHLFLFTDLLVITKKKSNGNYSVIDYCTRAMMQMTVLEDSMPPTNKYLILLTILENHEHKTIEIVLSCDTESGRQRWLEATAPLASSNPEETLYEQWDCPQVSVNHTYTAQQPDELNLQPGDVINVLRKMSDGWYHGERIRDGQKGWFPGNYTSEIASSHARAKNLKQRYRLLALSGSYLQSQEMMKKKPS